MLKLSTQNYSTEVFGVLCKTWHVQFGEKYVLLKTPRTLVLFLDYV